MPRAVDNKRERIMEAAVAVFARKGFYNARVSEIAKAAGVADGTIYLYFKNKDDILISIFEEKMSWFIALCKERLQGIDNPLDRLETIIRYQLELFEKAPEMAEVLTVELRQSSKFMREYRPKPFLEFLRMFTEAIRDAQQANLIAPEYNPRVVQRAIFGAMYETTLAWAMGERKHYALSDAASQLARMFIHGLQTPSSQNTAPHNTTPALRAAAA